MGPIHPNEPLFKRTVVDVKCKDNGGRVFIVEMQMEWTDRFMQRLLFGTAQAFVKQLVKGERYSLLCPVYGLGLVNAIFDKTTDNGYHPYSMVAFESSPAKIIEGCISFLWNSPNLSL